MKVVVIYYSRGGTTAEMAEIIHQEFNSKGVKADIFPVDGIKPKQLLGYDGIVIGSPTYYGTLAGEVKKFLDDSVSFHGKLDGKIGAAFSSAGNLAGGNETTILSILEAMLIHGMVIMGDPKGDHYGPVTVGSVDSRCTANCKRMVERFVTLLNKVKK